jgi:hypothetical protein
MAGDPATGEEINDCPRSSRGRINLIVAGDPVDTHLDDIGCMFAFSGIKVLPVDGNGAAGLW